MVRRRDGSGLLVALLLVAVGVTGSLGAARPTAAATAPARARPPITVVSDRAVDPRLHELTLTTPALDAPTHLRVLLPKGYDPAGTTRYPVLYLLHGGFGNYTDWTTVGQAEPLTADLPLIVVMPDGGQGGWYTNWSNYGAGGPPEWETYHVEQLIPWIDAHYRTVADRSGRGIAGLSMGGFGTMSYAARHPDLFTAAASFSGAVDLRNLPVRMLIGISPLATDDAPGSIFGVPPVLDAPLANAHNPWALAANLRGMHIALYTGNGHPGPLDGPGAQPLDIQEYEVHQMNVSLHQRLASLGIAHTWVDYGNGSHSWPYWNRDLSQELPALMATFATNGAVPAAPAGAGAAGTAG